MALPAEPTSPRRAPLRVAMALGGIAGAVLAVAGLARLPWPVWTAAVAALTLLAAALGWAWRRHHAPVRAQRWLGTATGMDAHLEPWAVEDRDTLLPALLPLAERRRRQLAVTQGRLTVHVGPGVSQVRLPLATVRGLAQVLDTALDDATRHARARSRLRFELDLRHGETGSHLRLAVIGPALTAATDARAADSPTRSAPRPRAVTSMQRLATALGAQLDIEQGAEGACVEWVLPLAIDRRAPAA